MGDLQTGDRVFNEHGRPVVVSYVTDAYVPDECYELTFSDGSTLVADADHQWLVHDKAYRKSFGRRIADKDRKPKNSPQPTTAPRVLTTKQMVDAGVSYGGKESAFAIPVAAPLQFPVRKLSIDPYVLGVWLGDGSSRGAQIYSADAEIVEEVRRRGFAVTKMKAPYAYSVQAPDKSRADSLVPKLRALRLLQDKHIPPVYLEASVEQRLDLLCGLMDTDGYVDPRGKCEFTTTCDALALGMHELLAGLGLKAKIGIGTARLYGRDCGPKYRITFTPHIPVFHLSRKLERQQLPIRHWTQYRYITAIKPVAPRLVKCITVDSPSHLYLAGEACIPTHNTVVGAHMVREEALIPNGLIWCMGPNFKVLHDSTIPTLLGIIPPSWVAAPGWNSDLMEFPLVNGTKIAFRSLDDPERGRGPGPTCGWFDEAAQIPHQGWNVFRPSLSEQAGIAIFTTTVLGFDWTYETIEKKALIEKVPGYYAVKWWTEENPLFQYDEVLKAEIEEARLTLPPELFAQEYRAERHNATGAIYAKYLSNALLQTDEAIKKYIPEWPNIDSSREIWIGLDAGADHPFGALMGVVTEWGVIVVAEYLLRDSAYLVHYRNIYNQFGLRRFSNIKWVANKNERQLRAEFGLQHVGVIQAENKHEFGIQRVQSWFVSNQLFIAHTCPHTFDQLTKYRYAVNTASDGQQKKEGVYKLEDELPDCLRYLLMAYPRLPDPKVAAMTDSQKFRWERLDERSRMEIERMREYHKSEAGEDRDLKPTDNLYPMGNFFGVQNNF